ncbi:MAG: hypothetical protein WCS31_12765 [Verrucomicrobiae bacterium]
MKTVIYFLICVLFGASLLGEDSTAWRQDGKPVADTPHMKSKNGFGAQLFLTESAQFFKDWNKPETPSLTTLKNNKAHRNVPLFSAVLFVDPGTDSNGSVDVTYDIVIRKPDGSIYGAQKDFVGLKGKCVVPAHALQLAQERMGIQIDSQDPSGTYTVEITVRDHMKKVELPLKATFEVAR